jgi:hypothetical protein
MLNKLSEKYNINNEIITTKVKIPTLESINIKEVNKLVVDDNVYYISDKFIYEKYSIINKNLYIGKQIGYIKDKNIYINKFDKNI